MYATTVQPDASFRHGKMVFSLCRNGCTDRPSTWSTDCGRTLSPKAQSLVKNTYSTIPSPEGKHQCDKWKNQRYILRDRQPSTAACPACWSVGGEKGIEIVREQIFSNGPTRAAKANSSHSPLFQQSARPLLPSLSGHKTDFCLYMTKINKLYIAFYFYHKTAVKQDHYMTHLLSFLNTVLLYKIHRYVA
jgi:hypothetical protein